MQITSRMPAVNTANYAISCYSKSQEWFDILLQIYAEYPKFQYQPI